jgi:putative transposase
LDRVLYISYNTQTGWAEGEWELIRQSLQRGQLTGSKKFVDQIEEKLNQRVEFRGPGRPKKNK